MLSCIGKWFKWKKNEIIINKEHKFISLGQRRIWTNKKLDFVCIEIKENKDEIHTFYFFEKNIFESNYLNEKVLIFGTKTDKQLGFSNGIIKKIKNHFLNILAIQLQDVQVDVL